MKNSYITYHENALATLSAALLVGCGGGSDSDVDVDGSYGWT